MIKLESCLYNPDPNNQFNLSIKSLIINKGARVFIIGPSGSGKTTLMKALTGLLPNCEGQLYIDGDQVNNSGFPLNRKGIMFLSQDLGLWPHLTCEEHVAFVRSKGKSLKDNDEYCWLDAVGIKNKSRSRPHKL
jgi:ABC-type Fe3+/spermidine/putrescine transport system ATPase subunit